MRSVKRLLAFVAASAGVVVACSSGTDPGQAFDHLEIRLVPTRAYYPVPDTARARVSGISRDGKSVPVDFPTWRSLTPGVARVDEGGLIRAVAPGEAIIEGEVNGLTVQVGLSVRGVLHAGYILDRNETWLVSDTPHVVRDYLTVGGIFGHPDTTVLTIEPGATVRFRPGAGMLFGDIDPGVLIIPAGGDPVVMERDSAGPASWVGLSFIGRGRSELRNLTIRHCGRETPSGNSSACIAAGGRSFGHGTELLIDNVTIAEGHNGLAIGYGVTFVSGSRDLSIENTDGAVASVNPLVVGTFPHGGHFTGNAEGEIRITNGLVDRSATWANAGVPWRLSGGVEFTGSSRPKLTLSAGFHLRADPGTGFTIGLGRLTVGEPGGAPVVLESTGQGWGGIEIAHGGGSALYNALLQDCTRACLRVSGINETDTGIVVQDVTIRGADSAGVRLDIWGLFNPASRNLTITETAGVPIITGPEGLFTIPTGDYRFNGTDVIQIRGGTIWQTATLRNLGVPYRAPDGLLIDSSIDPPTLTVDPGVTIQMGIGKYLTVGVGTLVAVGTATEPITFTSATPGVPGSWVGVELGADIGVQTRLDQVEITDAGAGSSGFGGALRLRADPGGVLRNSRIRRSPTCGVILFGGQPWTDDYTDSSFGNEFIDVAGPLLCAPPP